MILLDTNLASEAMKTRPDPAVRAWLNEQSTEMLCLSSVSLAELLFGIAALPSGKRKDSLSAALDGLIAVCRGGILSFDAVAARRSAGRLYCGYRCRTWLPSRNPGYGPV